ncbi:MAG: hemolysin III family protein [Clostridiaceae bacterium]
MKKIILREPINSLTHLAGAAVFFIGTIILITNRILLNAGVKDIIGAIIFGLSLVLLYLASGIYHGYNGSEKGIKVLKKLDHSMIYVLIAGSYTPICLHVLDGNKRILILTVVWGIAIFGIFSKIYINNIPRVLYTFFYLLMGWMVVFFIKDLYRNVDTIGFNLLVLGGILYSIGGVIYMIKKPNISKIFGFHELFHLFILGGSLSHYFLVFKYLI